MRGAPRGAWVQVGVGVAVVALSLDALRRGDFGRVLPIVGIAAAAFAVGLFVQYIVAFANRALVDSALDAMARGQLEEAEAILRRRPQSARRGLTGRQIRYVEAWIAYEKSQFREAIELTTRALASIPPKSQRWGWAHVRLGMRAIRALAAASAGEVPIAADDIASIRADACSFGDVLAQASLAEAVLLDRQAATQSLAELLRRDHRLLLEMTTGPQRALARTLMQKVDHARAGAYREPARRREPVTAGASRPSSESGARVEEKPITEEALTQLRFTVFRVPKVKEDRVSGWQGALVGAGAMGGVLLFVVRAGRAPGAIQAADAAFLVGVGLVFASILQFVRVMARLRPYQRLALEASRLSALKGAEAARHHYVRLTTFGGFLGAQAEDALADLEERKAAFGECLAACDRGLSRIARMGMGMPIFPHLVARRAYALAALDRRDEARTHLALVERDCPRFAQLTRARFRVRLLLAVRAGDLERAGTIAAERTPHMPLGLRDQTLADAVVAIGERSYRDAARIERELAGDADLRAWLGAVAPKVVEEVERLAAEAA